MDKRPVECQDCGHRFETKQEYPQCSDPHGECGRSRDVIEVSTKTEPETIGETNAETEPETKPEMSDDGDGWTPLFDAETVETEAPGDAGLSTGDIDEADDEDVADALDEGLGDPKDFDAESPDIPELEADDIRPILDATFDAIAARKGDRWALSDSEADRMADAYAALGTKYLPHLLAERGVEITAIVVTATVVLPRLQADKADEKTEEEANEDSSEETGLSGMLDSVTTDETDINEQNKNLAIANV